MRLAFLSAFLLITLSCARMTHYERNILANEIKLCFVGDTGVDSKVQETVALELEKEECHSIHFTGDIIYPNGLEGPKQKDFYEKFWKYYEPLTVKGHRPYLNLVMGNHDHRAPIGPWITLGKEHEKIFFPHTYYFLKINELCLIHLDTNYYDLPMKYFMGALQYEWLTQIEDEMKSCPQTMAITHHPYKSHGGHGNAHGTLKKFLKKKIIGKFDYLVSGHDHILSDEGKHKDTHQLISGAGGVPSKGENPGYLVFYWNKESKNLRYEFRSLTK